MKPDFLFVQEINPKYPIWYPQVSKEVKVVHFAWWDEVKHLNNPYVNVDITILKQSDDLKYGYDKYPNKFLGNLRLDHLNYINKVSTNKKTCFIPETYLRMGDKDVKNSMKVVKFCDSLINFLHKKDFKVVWKKREKGYPIEKWASRLDFMTNQPDLIIHKDLRFPSSLCEHAYLADCCIVINDSFAFFDIMHMNDNCIILTTEGGRQQKIDDFFLPEYEKNIIDMKNTNSWKILSNRVEKKNEYVYNKNKNISKLILDLSDKL